MKMPESERQRLRVFVQGIKAYCQSQAGQEPQAFEELVRKLERFQEYENGTRRTDGR